MERFICPFDVTCFINDFEVEHIKSIKIEYKADTIQIFIKALQTDKFYLEKIIEPIFFDKTLENNVDFKIRYNDDNSIIYKGKFISINYELAPENTASYILCIEAKKSEIIKNK